LSIDGLLTSSTGQSRATPFLPMRLTVQPPLFVATGPFSTGTPSCFLVTRTVPCPWKKLPLSSTFPTGSFLSKKNLTIEIWATPISGSYNQRIFDFGRGDLIGDGLGAEGEFTGADASAPAATQNGTSYLCLISQVGTNLNQLWCAMRLSPSQGVDLPIYRISSYGTPYHYVVTFQDGAGEFGVNGGLLSCYRNGVLISQSSIPFRLQHIADVNNWIGRSQFTLEPNSNSSFDEIRIYNHALSPAEVTAGFQAGPDAAILTPPPIANPDSATIHHGQKVRLHVSGNDGGNLAPASITIVQAPQYGSAVPDGSGVIRYAHTAGSPSTDTFTYRVWNYSHTLFSEATATIDFSSSLRIPTVGLNVPLVPPATAFQVRPAFPGLQFSQGVAMASPPGDTHRLFVAERPGRIQLIPDVTAASPSQETFLDLPALLQARDPAESVAAPPTMETGLLGLAFHPNHASNGYFYIYYTVEKGGAHFHRLSRFGLHPENPNAANPESEFILLEQPLFTGVHNGGDIHFGPDGYLYLSLGDGCIVADDQEHSQRIDQHLAAGILRIDVDQKPGSLPPNPHPDLVLDAGNARFSIPADNPFVGATTFNGQPVSPTSVRTEFWAVGLRNPWRFSFDPETGNLWCGDVGQSYCEEINLIARGGNYGWAYLEGTASGYPGSRIVPENFESIPPVHEYLHTHLPGDAKLKGNSVTGGIVYHGTRIPSLRQKYIFADFSSGNIWASHQESGTYVMQRITGLAGIVAISGDPSNGDVLFSNFYDGKIYRLTGDGPSGNFPQTLGTTGLFSDLADLSPAPGVLPYSVNLPFWSDFADKRRWFAMPDTTSRMTWAKEGTWTFPEGTVWVKHFDLETTRGNPETRKRIETRMLVRNQDGVYGVSYRWNEAQNEANLVAEGGEDFPLSITENGVARTQVWHIPSRSECNACHNEAAGYSLSFNTRQLNLPGAIHGFTGNQVQLLRDGGFFDNLPESVNVLPRHVRPDETNHSLEARARSYLAVNCDFCHRPGGTAPTQWDARAQTTLAGTGLIDGEVTNNGGDPANKLIVPGSPAHSVVWNRVATANGFTRMPPIASNELDPTGIALLNAWITDSLPHRVSYGQWRQFWFETADSPDGDPLADPESDGRTNQEEFLRGTNPLQNTADFTGLYLSSTTQSVTITGEVPPNRSVQIETSTDMIHWSLWDVPNNNAMFTTGGSLILTGSMDDPMRVFRLKLSEN
jgi:uncharacterized repeat protein (TIGR03806 family)